eukprot:TRINITY_DN27184_c0_g1_i1.p1 TRINITY_DN27184_c0_g1~~TRINITY_DN27184_c0_g1_i1.p1  ORF type:complete len:233 (-),score=9.73 TRINITY_DN27184_c0_g1_i1:244-942(-)
MSRYDDHREPNRDYLRDRDSRDKAWERDRDRARDRDDYRYDHKRDRDWDHRDRDRRDHSDRDREREREQRERERDRERERERERERREAAAREREWDRDRERDRSESSRNANRYHYTDDYTDDSATWGGRRTSARDNERRRDMAPMLPPAEPELPKAKKSKVDESLSSVIAPWFDDATSEMLAVMGMTGFGSTKGKKVAGNEHAGGMKVKPKQKFAALTQRQRGAKLVHLPE